jgi:CDGSH-type Zn-finger protein
MRRYTLDELEALPTLAVGQADNLKIDNGDGLRVWLCRCGVEDGMPYNNQVTIEEYDGERWSDVETYQAR